MAERIPVLQLPNVPEEMHVKIKIIMSEINNLQLDPLDGLARLYKFSEEYNEFIATFTSCTKGCSYCCNYDVSITSLEAIYIGNAIGVRPNLSKTEASYHYGTPCPFLKPSGECGTYAFRPMACRSFHALGDPENCLPGRYQSTYGTQATGFSNFIYSDMMNWVQMKNFSANGMTKDIRSFFPLMDL